MPNLVVLVQIVWAIVVSPLKIWMHCGIGLGVDEPLKHASPCFTVSNLIAVGQTVWAPCVLPFSDTGRSGSMTS